MALPSGDSCYLFVVDQTNDAKCAGGADHVALDHATGSSQIVSCGDTKIITTPKRTFRLTSLTITDEACVTLQDNEDLVKSLINGNQCQADDAQSQTSIVEPNDEENKKCCQHQCSEGDTNYDTVGQNDRKRTGGVEDKDFYENINQSSMTVNRRTFNLPEFQAMFKDHRRASKMFGNGYGLVRGGDGYGHPPSAAGENDPDYEDDDNGYSKNGHVSGDWSTGSKCTPRKLLHKLSHPSEHFDGDVIKRKTMGFLRRNVPIFDWMRKYDFRKDLNSDMMAGVTLAVFQIPQCKYLKSFLQPN